MRPLTLLAVTAALAAMPLAAQTAPAPAPAGPTPLAVGAAAPDFALPGATDSAS